VDVVFRLEMTLEWELLYWNWAYEDVADDLFPIAQARAQGLARAEGVPWEQALRKAELDRDTVTWWWYVKK
jgi:hypothetical protein